jgi:hypothetical protein
MQTRCLFHVNLTWTIHKCCRAQAGVRYAQAGAIITAIHELSGLGLTVKVLLMPGANRPHIPARHGEHGCKRCN